MLWVGSQLPAAAIDPATATPAAIPPPPPPPPAMAPAAAAVNPAATAVHPAAIAVRPPAATAVHPAAATIDPTRLCLGTKDQRSQDHPPNHGLRPFLEALEKISSVE